MPLITEPKTATTVAPSQPARPEVTMGRNQATTARAESLKQRLTEAQRAQPNTIAPRQAGSSARQEQYSKLQAYQNTAPVQTTHTQPMQDVEPPPVQPVSVPTEGAPIDVPATDAAPQLANSVETTDSAPEASSEPLSPQFVALAKQERQLRKARQELKAQQDAWKSEQARFVNTDELKTDPLGTLSKLGLTYDRLTELQLSQISPDPNQSLINKITELEAKLAAVDEQFTKRDSAAYDAAVNQIRSDVKLLVDADPAFETIKATGESEAVVELIRKVFDSEGTILAVEEAAKMVEDKLVEVETERLRSLQRLSKIKSRLGTMEKPVVEQGLQQQPTQKTLSNAGSVARPLTARERAIMAFESAKNKG